MKICQVNTYFYWKNIFKINKNVSLHWLVFFGWTLRVLSGFCTKKRARSPLGSLREALELEEDKGRLFFLIIRHKYLFSTTPHFHFISPHPFFLSKTTKNIFVCVFLSLCVGHPQTPHHHHKFFQFDQKCLSRVDSCIRVIKNK